jgi:hypothetical protein
MRSRDQSVVALALVSGMVGGAPDALAAGGWQRAHAARAGRLSAVPTFARGTASTRFVVAIDAQTLRPVLLHFTGRAWRRFGAPTLPRQAHRTLRFVDVLQSGRYSVWVTVEQSYTTGTWPTTGLYHWDGVRWWHVRQLRQQSPAGLALAGAGGLWLHTLNRDKPYDRIAGQLEAGAHPPAVIASRRG